MASLTKIQPPTKLPVSWRDLLACFARPANHLWCCILILLGLCVILFFQGLTVGELWRTENLRALIALEMLRSGNWIVPTLHGEPLFTKPPGMYVAIALCSLPFGAVTEWTARLPSALAATGTVFLFFWYASRQLGRLGGLIAAIVLPLSTMWLEKATAAEIDMLHVFWSTAAILFFLRAIEGDEEMGRWGDGEKKNARPQGTGLGSPYLRISPSWFWWLASACCLAAGALTKWSAPVFLYLMAVPLLWWRGQLRLLWSRRHVVGLAVAGGICLAWVAAAISLGGWTEFYTTVKAEAMARFAPGYVPKPYPWLESLLHPLVVLAVALPFSALVLFTFHRGFFRLWDEKGQQFLVALHCWVWPNVLFWSLPRDHSPRNIFPLLPGIAGLAAMVLLAWIAGKMRWPLRKIRPQFVLIAMLILWIGVKSIYVHVIYAHRSSTGQLRDKGEFLAALVPLHQVLYVFNLKESGVTLYYGRPVQQLASPAELPGGEPVYCMVYPQELGNLPASQRVEIIRHMIDSQGDPIVIIRVTQP